MAIELPDSGRLPTEFCIFTPDKVVTTKGTFIFDDVSAQRVMAEYEAHGIDLMIDYDHASLGTDRAPDPAHAGKAAGWFNIEVRNGALWAVNVRWTEPAAQMLMKKEWRFMSPAFETDKNRIVSLLNVAITNLPATRRLEPLMAASSIGETGMSPETVKEALDALIAGDAAKCQELLKNLVAEAASGEAVEPVTEEVVEEAPAEMSAPPAAPLPEETKDEVVAASARLMRLTGKTSYVDAITEVASWRESHLKLETETQKLAAERATLEAAERRKLCVELVTLGAEFPSTVWADDKASKLKSRWTSMPITELQTHVAEQRSARGGKRVAASASAPIPAAPAGERTMETPHGVVTISAREIETCERLGAKLEVYAANKAFQIKARGSKE